MKLFKNCLLMAALLTGVVFFVLPQTVMAQAKEDICKGVELTGGTCDPGKATGPSVQGTIEVVINVLSVFVGVIAVIMIIIGGLRYITSAGDSNSAAAAKNTILYAVIGLVVVAVAQGIVKFVVNRF